MGPGFLSGVGGFRYPRPTLRAQNESGRFNVVTNEGRGKGLAALLGLLVVLHARGAHADTAQLDRFEPAERGSRFFAADSLELDGRLRFVPGVVTSYASRLRVFGEPEGTQRHLVANELVLHPGASLVMAPGARFAIDLPLYFQSGTPTNLSGQYYLDPRSPVLGDTRLAFDLRLAGPSRPHADGVTVAGGVAAYLPTGSQDDYTSDGTTRFAVRLGASARAKWLLAAARAGYMYRRPLDSFGALRIGSELEGTLGLGWTDGAWVVGPELRASTILRNEAFKRRASPVELLFGIRRTAGDATLALGGGPSIVRGIGAPDYRLVASLEWAFGNERPSDRDRDGFPDDDDACPDTPGPLGGCPGAPADRDGDGVVDSVDACPEVPGRRGPDAITNGCADSDHDGIPDPVDACPSIAGVPSRDGRVHGCPRDADGDGIPDVLDACPDVPGVVTNQKKTHGCPRPVPPADRDKDGIPDAEDACPDHPGKRYADRAANGCPLVRWAGDQVAFAEPLTLSADGPVFDGPEAYAILDAIAAWFATHEEVQLVRIEAHCDEALPRDRRPRARWTEEQARLVRDELVRRGVAKQRIEARGMGDLTPIAPNDTPESRRRNRRVELHVVR